MSPRSPLDSFPYDRDPRSAPLASTIADGLFIYVQDIDGIVYVLPDGSHMHPKVLGNAKPALYAGDLRIVNSEVADLTNLSGTFLFEDPNGLLNVALQIETQGLIIQPGAVRFFPQDGSPPSILR